MPARLIDDLAALTGEELFWLARKICHAREVAIAAAAIATTPRRLPAQVRAMACELEEIRDDVLIQFCRFNVPVSSAQVILARSSRGRQWLKPVPGIS